MSGPESLLEFPTDFPLKIMGRNTAEFRSLVLGIVRRHAGDLAPENIAEKPSRNGAFLGLTCTFRATSRAQLDALYEELTACEKVLVVL
jgi:uncharacterized protein